MVGVTPQDTVEDDGDFEGLRKQIGRGVESWDRWERIVLSWQRSSTNGGLL